MSIHMCIYGKKSDIEKHDPFQNFTNNFTLKNTAPKGIQCLGKTNLKGYVTSFSYAVLDIVVFIPNLTYFIFQARAI